MTIGILAVQGDFEAHGEVLSKLGVEWLAVRKPVELEGLAGLILPGGESTTQLKFLKEEGLEGAIREFVNRGGAVFGTCAGAILLAREVRNPAQESLGLLDIVVARNAYGRQVASEVRLGNSKLWPDQLEMVFIRAPQVVEAGKNVEVLAELDGQPVLMRQGKVMVATFHPELSAGTAVHSLFLQLSQNGH